MDDPRAIRRDTAGPTAPDELGELLALYAARRLSPRYGAMPRIRAAILSTSGDRAVLPRDTAAARRSRGRRLVALGLAATLTVGSAAAVLAAGPDSPLYGARVWLETLMLPTQADDRADAHRARLEARLAEAHGAAQAGDPAAVAQALAAYRAEVEAALADVGDDAEQLAKLEAALGTHLVVLSTLEDLVPPQAADAIHAAQEASGKAVEKIKAKKADPARPTPRANRS